MNFIKIIRERKIIDGVLYRKYFVDSQGKEIGIPLYINLQRKQDYYYVSIAPNKKKHPNSFMACERYYDFHTQEIAIKRSIAILKSMIKGNQLTMPEGTVTPKRSTSIEKLGLDLTEVPAGVAVNLLKTPSAEFISIGVSYFDPNKKKFRAKTFYVGTLNNWKERFPQKLQMVISVRMESLKLYEQLTKVS